MGEVFLPALTALAHRSKDDTVRLGRVTAWEGLPGGGEIPQGQKIFFADNSELPFLEVERVSWRHDAKEQV